MHREFVDDLRFRRQSYLEPTDMVLLLKCYVLSQTVQGPASDEFYSFCDKFLGKRSDELTS